MERCVRCKRYRCAMRTVGPLYGLEVPSLTVCLQIQLMSLSFLENSLSKLVTLLASTTGHVVYLRLPKPFLLWPGSICKKMLASTRNAYMQVYINSIYTLQILMYYGHHTLYQKKKIDNIELRDKIHSLSTQRVTWLPGIEAPWLTQEGTPCSQSKHNPRSIFQLFPSVALVFRVSARTAHGESPSPSHLG